MSLSDESSLIIGPSLDLDETPPSGRDIIQLNQSWAKLYKERRQRIIHLVRQLPLVIEGVKKRVDKGYRVIIPSEALRRLKDGTAHWAHWSSGLLGVTIHDNETGQIIHQASLEEISPEILPAISQLAVQRTLADIVQRLEAIDQKISDVLQELENDRLAIAKAGIYLYQQAIAANDMETRRQLLVNAIQQLNEGRELLMESLKTDVQFVDSLPRKKWQIIVRSLFEDIPALVRRKGTRVQKGFQAILRASCVLALAYEALDEPESLRISLEPLRGIVLEIGKKGEQIARWLPYGAAAPPEELWRTGPLWLADGIDHTVGQLGSIQLKAVEIGFVPDEVMPGEVK